MPAKFKDIGIWRSGPTQWILIPPYLGSNPSIPAIRDVVQRLVPPTLTRIILVRIQSSLPLDNSKVCAIIYNMKTNLYRKRSDGSIALLEVNSDSFPDRDAYEASLDFHMEQGYFDSYEEAKNA